MNKFVVVTLAASLFACNKDSGTTATTSSSAPAASTAAAPKEKSVDLAPLPLKLTVPSEESAMTMDMSMGDNKSVSMSFEAVNAGINVSQPIEKSFAEVKTDNKNDKILFPFKRWVKEGADTAVEEFSNDGKTGYLALSWKTVGGKSYLCKSNGLSGLKSPDDADKVLKVCDTLAAK